MDRNEFAGSGGTRPRQITMRCCLFSVLCLTLSLSIPSIGAAQSASSTVAILDEPIPDADGRLDPDRIAGLDWAPSLQVALQQAAAKLLPVLVVVTDAEPPRDARLFAQPALVEALGHFVPLRAASDDLDDHLAFDDGIGDARYVVLDPTGRILARLRASEDDEDPDESIAHDLRAVWTDYLERAVESLTQGLKGRHQQTREQALHDAAILLDSAPDTKALRTAITRYLRKQKKDHDRRAAWNVLASADTVAAFGFIASELDARSPGHRQAALDVFQRATPRVEFVPLMVKRARKEKNEDCLHRVIRILEKLSPIAPDASKALGRLTTHSLPTVRALASLAAVSKSPYPAIQSTLLRRAKREANETVRLASILAVAKIDERDALGTLERARRREKRETAIRDALDLAIASLHGTAAKGELDDAIDTLRKSIDRSAADERDNAPRNDRRYTGRDR